MTEEIPTAPRCKALWWAENSGAAFTFQCSAPEGHPGYHEHHSALWHSQHDRTPHPILVITWCSEKEPD